MLKRMREKEEEVSQEDIEKMEKKEMDQEIEVKKITKMHKM